MHSAFVKCALHAALTAVFAVGIALSASMFWLAGTQQAIPRGNVQIVLLDVRRSDDLPNYRVALNRSSELLVLVSPADEPVHLRLLRHDGRAIVDTNVRPIEGLASVAIPTNTLVEGTYRLELMQGAQLMAAHDWQLVAAQ